MPVPIPTETMPVPQGQGKIDPGLMQKLTQIMGSVGKSMQDMSAPPSPQAPGVVSQARIGQAPQTLAGPQGVAGLPQAQPGGIRSSSAPPPGSAMPQIDSRQTPGPTAIPFEYGSRAARTGATVYGAIQNITDVMNSFKKRRDQEIAHKAEVLSRSLYDAIERGDKDLISTLLDGKDGAKNLKLLEKAGIGVPPEIKTEPPSPEEAGVMQGLRHVIAAKGSQAQQAQQLQAEAARLASAQQVQEMQQAGEAGAQARRIGARGTGLSPEQITQADEYASQIKVSPVLAAQMSAEELQFDRQLGQRISEVKQTYDLEMKRLAQNADQFRQSFAQDERFQKDQVAYWKTLAGLEKARIDNESARVGAATKDEFYIGQKLLLDNYNDQLTNIDDVIAALAGRERLTDRGQEVMDAYVGLRGQVQGVVTELKETVESRSAVEGFYKALKDAGIEVPEVK